jgi:hypothetical protein
MSPPPPITPATIEEIARIVHWYLDTAYGRWEGPGTVPFYGDPRRIGRFAVDLVALAARDSDAIFHLLITLGAYQSRRDVDIMAIQRSIGARRAAEMTSSSRLRVLVESSACAHTRDPDTFDRCCDVRRDLERDRSTCGARPRARCHVKDATAAIGRMGDLGKMPTSAWLHLGAGGPQRWFAEACLLDDDPHARARRLVARVSTLYRIGVKLASMFVTMLSVPELHGSAAWAPEVDGSRIVVVDANVGRAINVWRRNRGPKTYAALARWLIAAADQINLSRMRSTLPRRSPRLVQQAVYLFRSRSNRAARGDACAVKPCSSCPSRVCPFLTRVHT